MTERFLNIVKLGKKVNYVNLRYKFNTRLDREDIKIFKKADTGINLLDTID